MSTRVVSLLRWERREQPQPRDWSTQELAEFYRVEAALVNSGMRVESDRGLTDEEDPWFVFCRSDDKEIIAHIARIDSEYLVSIPASGKIVRGRDFRELVRDLVERQPFVELRQHSKSSNIILHPTALLVALIATAFFKTSEAHASTKDADSPTASHTDHGVDIRSARPASRHSVATSDAMQPAEIGAGTHDSYESAFVLTAIAFAMEHDSAVDAPAGGPANPAPLLVADLSGNGDLPSTSFGFTLRDGEYSGGLDQWSSSATANDTSGAAESRDDHTANVLPTASDTSKLIAAWDSNNIGDSHASMFTADTDSHGLLAFDELLPVKVAPIVVANAVKADAPLPTAAIEVAFAAGGAVTPNSPSVVYDNQLSTTVVTILNSATHEQVVADGALAASGSVVPAQGTQHAASDVNVSPGATVTTSSSPLSNQMTSADTVKFANVETEIQQFEAEAVAVKVIVTADSVIIYDANAIDHHLAQVNSLTFDFADGSSISIVGTQQELSHLHA